MARPLRFVRQNLTRLGRLEIALAGALADRDTPRALDRLRALYPRFEQLGKEAAPLWLPFLDSVFDARFRPHLREADFDRLGGFGDHLAEAGAVGWPRSRWPIVQACAARGTAADLRRAYRLLTEVYHVRWTQHEHRLRAAAWLARLGAVDDVHLSVYAEMTTRRPPAPPEVAARVAEILDVGFDSDAERLRRACSLAERLGGPTASAGTARVAAVSVDTAFVRGLGELLLHDRPRSAAPLFTAALARTPDHAEALRGLLCVGLRTREFPTAISAAEEAAVLTPRCADLLLLCRTLAWLDGSGTSGGPLVAPPALPATSARLAAITPGRDTGPWRDYALGRTCLVEGDARQARQVLTGVLDAGLPEADVHYHAAWAHLLCRDPGGVRASYDALAGAAGSWALGCLLQDAEPGQPLPDPVPAVPHGFAQVAWVRRALVGDGPLPPALEVRSLFVPGALQADLFEALRTALAVAAAHGGLSGSGTLRHPLFARLPAAERLMWTGLSVRESRPEDGRRTLRRALELGRDRAAVLLALDAVREGRPAEARELLRDVRGPKAALLVAWADAHDGAETDAAEPFAKLFALGLAPADHASALLALRDAADAWAHGAVDSARAHAARAVTQLRSASRLGKGRFEVLPHQRAAESLAAAADPAELNWQDAAAQPWAARLLGLARLVRAPESVDAPLVRSFPQWLPPTTHGAALAQVALRVVLLSEDEAARREAAAILARLGEHSPGPTVDRAARCGAEGAEHADRAGLRTGEQGADLSGDPLAALAGAGQALDGQALDGQAQDGPDLAAAVRRLRAVRPESGRADQAALVALLANALEGRALPAPLPFDAPATVAAALAAATAAGQAAAGNTAAAVDTLLAACLAHEMDGLVDLRRVLPHLVVSAAGRGRREAVGAVLAPIMRQVLADGNGSDGNGSGGNGTGQSGTGGLAFAYYSTMLGDFATAENAWRRLLERTASGADGLTRLRGEYGRFLCHRAASAHLGGDRPTVLRSMRLAARYLPETARERYEELASEQLVATLVDTLLPESPVVDRRWLGRHPRLVELARANPDLGKALTSGTAELILKQWRLASLRAGYDIELWHTLAVLAREDALARPLGSPAALPARTTATALWCVLLTDPALRAHFARHTLPGEADDSLRDELTGALLADRKAQLTEATAQDDQDTAEQCLRCLDAVQHGLTATRRLLERGPFFAVAANLAGDDDAFAPIAERAGVLIDAWGEDLVAAGKRTLTDSEAISRLGEDSKLDKNYEAALSRLGIALLLERPPGNVLCAALDWGYDWFFCCHDQTDDEAGRMVLDVMRPFAEHLTPRCTPGRGHTAENKALSWFSYACGVSAARFARKVGGARRVELFDEASAHQERAGEWNPEWEPPRRELCRSRGEWLFARGDFTGAERMLRDLGDDNRQIAVLYNNHALDRLRDARALLRIAESGEHVDAAVDLADEYERMLLKAALLSPDDPVIRGNVEQISSIRADIAEKRSKLE